MPQSVVELEENACYYAFAMNLEDIRTRLGELSSEMSAIISEYDLSAESPLDVMENARTSIHVQSDYIKFLELSLEGRILADEGERLMKAQQEVKEREYLQ